MKDKIMFKLREKYFNEGTFKISVLKKFCEYTGCSILIEKTGIVWPDGFESFCQDDKLCKKTCNENENCHVKNTKIGGE